MKEYQVKVSYDRTEWYLNGQYHREDGPAIERTDGTKFWYRNDKIHRTDGPAIIRTDGSKYWYINGKLHRTDGPAIEYANGYEAWFLNGKELSEEEFNNRNKVELSLEEISEKFGIPIEQLRIKK